MYFLLDIDAPERARQGSPLPSVLEVNCSVFAGQVKLREEAPEPSHLGLGIFESRVLQDVAFVLLDEWEQVLDGPVIVLLPELPREAEAERAHEVLQDREVEIKPARPHTEIVEASGRKVFEEPKPECSYSFGRIRGAAESFVASLFALFLPPLHRCLVVGQPGFSLPVDGKAAVKFHLVAVLVEAERAQAEHLAADLVSGRLDVNHQFVIHRGFPPFLHFRVPVPFFSSEALLPSSYAR